MKQKKDKDSIRQQTTVGLWPVLRYQPLYKLTQAAILQKIEEGYFKEGDLLPSTRKMAEMFGVSIITIRNAIKKLQEKNILEIRHGHGVIVKKSGNREYERGLDNIIAILGKEKRPKPVKKKVLEQVSEKLNLREEVEELFDIRAMLESEVVGLACKRVDPESIHVLEDKIKNVLNREKISSYLGFQLDIELHNLIIQNCSNKRLVHMINKLNEEIEIYRLMHSKEMSVEYTREVLKDELLILNALLGRKPDKCGALVKKHIKKAKTDCLAKWKEKK